MIDRYEIYSNKKPPTPPKKKAAKFSSYGKKIGNLLNIGRKSKNAGLSPGWNLLLNLRFNSDLFPFNIFAGKISIIN